MRLASLIFLVPSFVWAAGFSQVQDGMNWASTQVAWEITLSISERSQVLGKGTYDTVAEEGMNAVSATTNHWVNWQTWLESECTNFVNTNHTIAGAHSISNWTLTTWRLSCGFSNGFRRATNWSVTADDWTAYTALMYKNPGYGGIQSGDIMGPWIVEDLQKGLKALTRTWTSNYWGAGPSPVRVYTTNGIANALGADQNAATALSNCRTDFANKMWTYQEDYFYVVYRRSDDPDFGGDTWNWYANRAYSTPICESLVVPNGVTHDWSLYWQPQVYGNSFLDIDGYGLTNGVLCLWDSGAGSVSTSITATTIGLITSFPPDVIPTNGPEEVVSEGVGCDGANWIFDWNFSYE